MQRDRDQGGFHKEIRNLRRVKEERGKQRFVQIYGEGRVPAGQPYEGAPFFVMELLVGKTLRKLLQDLIESGQRLATLDFLRIGHEILAAMRDAHGTGDPNVAIVHLDLKPENIFLHRRPKAEADEEIVDVVLLDLGLSDTPYSACRGGTPPYAAPDVSDPMGHVTCATDVYSLGVMFYEMATGHLPPGWTRRATLWQRAAKPLDLRPVEQLADLSGLDQILRRALSYDPRTRFRAAGEMLVELERLEAWKRLQRLQTRAEAWSRGEREALPVGDEAQAMLALWRPRSFWLPYPRAMAPYVEAVCENHARQEEQARHAALEERQRERKARRWRMLVACTGLLVVILAARPGLQRWAAWQAGDKQAAAYKQKYQAARHDHEFFPTPIWTEEEVRAVKLLPDGHLVLGGNAHAGSRNIPVVIVQDPLSGARRCVRELVQTLDKQEQVEQLALEGDRVRVLGKVRAYLLDMNPPCELVADQRSGFPAEVFPRPVCWEQARARHLQTVLADHCDIAERTAVFAGTLSDAHILVLYDGRLPGEEVCMRSELKMFFSPPATDLCPRDLEFLEELPVAVKMHRAVQHLPAIQHLPVQLRPAAR